MPGTNGTYLEKIMKCGVLCAVLAALSGCSFLLPYKSSFQCSETDKGKCVSMKSAYEESISGEQSKKEGKGGECAKCGKKSKNKEEPGITKQAPQDLYRENLYIEMAGLIKDPVTPLVVPPKVIRALVLPYPDGEKFYMPRYVFIMVDKPAWVLDGGLSGIDINKQ